MDKYIKELKKHLSPMNSNRKNEIIKEIKSSVDETNYTYDDMVSKFGTPYDLAQNYLEGVPVKKSLLSKIFNTTRNIVFIGAIIVFAIIISFVIYIYTKSFDEFDYSKYTAITVNKQVETLWQKALHVKSIDIDQAMGVFYWSDKEELEYSCKGRQNPTIQNGNFSTRHSVCYFKIPKQEIAIKLSQSKIVLIKPTSPISLNTKQSEVNLDPQGTNYAFSLKLQDSKIEDIKSHEQGVPIKGMMTESILQQYEY